MRKDSPLANVPAHDFGWFGMWPGSLSSAIGHHITQFPASFTNGIEVVNHRFFYNPLIIDRNYPAQNPTGYANRIFCGKSIAALPINPPSALSHPLSTL